MAALQRAVALEQVHHITVTIGKNLDLDVTKELCASRWALSKAESKSAAFSTRRMPLPPPPATALMSTG
jgi:hypothetical protein